MRSINLFFTLSLFASCLDSNQLNACTIESMAFNNEIRPEDMVSVDTIAYKEFGPSTAKHAIILLHGLGGSSRTWDALAKELGRDYRVITPDIRGHGETSYEGVHFDSAHIAVDVIKLANKLKIDQFVVIGHSMGGRVATKLAAEAPERVAGLIVEDMHVKGISTYRKQVPGALDRAREIRDLPLSYPNSAEFINRFTKFFGPKRAESMLARLKISNGKKVEVSKQYLDYLASVEIWSAKGLAEELGPDIAKVQAPTVFFAGQSEASGAVLFGKGIEHLRANKPDVVVKTFDAGHGIHHDQPAQYLHEVQHLVSKIEGF